MIGMPMIIAKVSRSRRIWISSLTKTAAMRPSEMPNMALTRHLFAERAHQMDEDVFETRVRFRPSEAGTIAIGGERFLERRLVCAADMQRHAEHRDLFDPRLVVKLVRQIANVFARHDPGIKL